MICTADADHIARLSAYEVFEGWDTLNGYLVVSGSLEAGNRVERDHSYGPWQMLACIQYAVHGWEPVDFSECERVEQDQTPKYEGDWAWSELYLLKPGLGAAVALVDLVDGMHPDAEWRLGTYPGFRLGKENLALAKVTPHGDVVATVAPCRNAPAPALQGTEAQEGTR